MIKSKLKTLVALTALAFTAQAFATDKYNTDIPTSIMTPDAVSTSIGELNFTDGAPTIETTQKLYDNLDTIRSTEVF